MDSDSHFGRREALGRRLREMRLVQPSQTDEQEMVDPNPNPDLGDAVTPKVQETQLRELFFRTLASRPHEPSLSRRADVKFPIEPFSSRLSELQRIPNPDLGDAVTPKVQETQLRELFFGSLASRLHGPSLSRQADLNFPIESVFTRLSELEGMDPFGKALLEALRPALAIDFESLPCEATIEGEAGLLSSLRPLPCIEASTIDEYLEELVVKQETTDPVLNKMYMLLKGLTSAGLPTASLARDFKRVQEMVTAYILRQSCRSLVEKEPESERRVVDANYMDAVSKNIMKFVRDNCTADRAGEVHHSATSISPSSSAAPFGERTLRVDNLERSLGFYCGVFGMRRSLNPSDLPYRGAWLFFGSEGILLLEVSNPDIVTGLTVVGNFARHARINCGNVECVRVGLQNAGIPYQQSMPETSARQSLTTHDPDGNSLEFIEMEALPSTEDSSDEDEDELQSMLERASAELDRQLDLLAIESLQERIRQLQRDLERARSNRKRKMNVDRN